MAVTVVAWLYVLVGVGGLIGHFHDIVPINRDGVWIAATEILAIVAGTFMLRGQNWARWLALAWILFHVGLSLLHSLGELAIHAAFCLLIAWALFQPESTRWFRQKSTAT